MRAKLTTPTSPIDPRRPGALVMPRTPVMGETWTLRDVLPQAGRPYPATVERTWHDDAGRLWVRFAAAGDQGRATDGQAGEGDGRGLVFEVWLRREQEQVQQL